MPDQSPFMAPSLPDPALTINRQQRCPVLLLLDTSGSMQGARIGELNAGLEVLRSELLQDALAAKRVDLAIITFGGTVEVRQGFATLEDWTITPLAADGNTPMGEALRRGLGLLQARKEEYKVAGLVPYYRPWMFLITDGDPTDAYQDTARDLRTAIEKKSVSFFAIGVEGANMDILNQLSPGRAALKLKGLAFKEMFQWLSSSLSKQSHSRIDEVVPLENPATPEGWAAV